ncbi:MAG: substrate-binding domain-containing protein [Acidimicrobiia bacterium]
MRASKWGVVLIIMALVAVACGDSGGGSDTTAEGGTDTTGASSEFQLREDAEGNQVEIPQTDEMQDTSAYVTEAPWTIGYADASLSNSARVFVNNFTEWAASGYEQIEEVARTDANDSPDKQVSDIEDLLVRGVDCLIVAATSEEAVNPAIEQAMADGIPVIIQERDVTTEDFVSHINILTYDIGTIQAEAAAEMLGGEGQVVLLEGAAGTGPAEEARRGHEEVLAEHPGIEILATEYTGWSRDEGKTIMENWLQAYDQIDAVIADSGIQQQGAYEAVAEAGRLDEVQVWTGDSLQAWIRQVDAEGIPAVIVNRPLTFGALAVDACAAILSGVEVPKNWYDPVEALDVAALDQYIAEDVPGSDEWWNWWDLPEEWLPE